MSVYSGDTTGGGGTPGITRRGAIAAKFAMQIFKLAKSGKWDKDVDLCDGEYELALGRIHRRAVERATQGRMTVVGDRIIDA